MTVIVPANQTRTVMTDVSVYSCTPVSAAGSAGSSISLLGVFEEVEITLNRESVDTDGAADVAASVRSYKWGKGSVRCSGFSSYTVGSSFAAIFAADPFVNLMFAESATGDACQLVCFNKTYTKSGSKGQTMKESLQLEQVGTPYFGAAGASPTAMAY